jgi:hypothetical protein
VPESAVPAATLSSTASLASAVVASHAVSTSFADRRRVALSATIGSRSGVST